MILNAQLLYRPVLVSLEFQALSGLYSRPVALRLASLTLNHLKTHLYSFVLSLLYK